MSTKTSIKRIALVAVSALGFGLLGIAPAKADAVTAASIVQKISLARVTAAPVVDTAVVVNMGLVVGDLTGETDGDTLNIRGYISTYPSGGFAQVTASETAVGTDSEIGVDAQSADSASGASYIITFTDSSEMGAGETVTATSAVGIGKYSFTPTKVGDHTLTVWADSDGDGAIDIGEAVQTLVITVAAAATVSSTLSTAYMTEPSANGVNASATTNAVARSAVKTANTGIAQIKVTLINTAGAADTRANTVTASVSGMGYVSVDTTANTPGTPTTRIASDNSGASVRYVHINADGTAGTGTVTVTVTDAVSGASYTAGTWSYGSYGDVTSLAVSSSIYTIGKAGGAASASNAATRTATVFPAFVVKATDGNGALANAASAPTIVPADTLVVASGACNLDDGDATYGSGDGIGYYNCNFTTAATAKSGDKTTLTIRIVDPADATAYLTTTYDVTVGGSAATETLAFDKASYSPGESMVITRTAVDSSGNPVYDGAASAAVTFNKAVGGTTPAAGTYVGGKSATSSTTPTVFAPATGGDFTAQMSGVTAGVAATIRATANVVSGEATAAEAASDAALEAIDAANAATDAANLAAEAADAATVAAEEARDAADAATAAVEALASEVATLMAALKAQITTLAKTVAKIAKKVKA